jgi:hypothetical protein
VLVEEPAEVLEQLEKEGDVQQAAKAADFFKRQEVYQQQRRQRMAARDQRLRRLEQLAVEDAAAVAAAMTATMADADDCSGCAAGRADSSIKIDMMNAATEVAAAAPAGRHELPDSSSEGVEAAASPLSSNPSLPGSASSGSVTGAAPSASAAAPATAADDIIQGAAAARAESFASGSSLTTDEDTCGICFDNNNHVAIKYCGHMLCVDCYRKMWELNGSSSSCPFCRAHLDGYVYLSWPLE